MERNRTRGLAALLVGAAGVFAAPVMGQVNNPELEINDSKAQANIVNSGGAGMASNDYITGTSTGTSTLVSGAVNSADYFRVRTLPAAAGVYRHRMILSSETPGHAGTIRGLNQSGGVIGTTDAVVQTSSATTFPARFNQWYGFGKGEEVYYRVTGTTSTTSEYVATLETTPVFVNDVFGTVYSGPVTITTVGQTTTDTDFWVYDSNFNAIPQWGNDDEGPNGPTLQSRIIRDMTPGTYYLAITNYNFANNQPSNAPDEDFRTGIVMEFPDACANSSTAVGGNLSFRIASDAGEIFTGASKNEPYEIVFFRIVVIDNPAGTPPSGIGAVDVASLDNCGDQSALFTVAASPGTNPPSTGLAVTGDLSSVGGSSFQTFFDDGTNGDVFAGDNVFSYRQTIAWGTPTGAKTIPWTLSDAQSRSRNGTITGLSVTACNRLGACCVPASGCQVTSQANCGSQSGSYQGDGSNCGTPNYSISTSAGVYEDISGSGTSSTAGNCDDCVQSGISIGFDFNFFENTYNTINISSNGNLQFTSALTTFTNAAIPTAGTPNNMICPIWDDFNTAITIGEVYYLTRGTAPNREFVVSWQNVAQFANTDSNSFQAVLFEGSNNIEFRYGQITPETPAGDYSIGIENITGTVGYSIPGAELGSGFTARMITYLPGENPCGGSCPWSSGGCIADYNGSGGTPDDADVAAFFDAWNNGDECSDANGSGGTPDDADVAMFFELWNNGGC
ncbi:MAG: hypothetical protein HUU18_12755 [Phycisphaerales bacterium]|nr:hypothetical protein [Phycisphaerales bacterium]